MSAPHNKGMNLTSALPRFARWHGRRSQVMPGVGRTVAMRAVVLVGLMAAAAGAGGQELPSQLVMTALQSTGLSVEGAWTAKVDGQRLTVERPGRNRSLRKLGDSEVAELLRTLERAGFSDLPPRLGFAGSCDDCARCVVDAGTPTGHHVVEFVATEPSSSVVGGPERRFQTVWRAVAKVARTSNVREACW